jgi:DNA-binding transcriptional regulator LsrR (DeoR family)
MALNQRDMIKVAHYYYNFGYNQQQVADKFGMSRQRVNRLLKQALLEGIVEIKIRDFSNVRIESELEVAFGLKEAIVADRNDIGNACMTYLKDIVQDGWNIGVASSTTIAGILRGLPHAKEKSGIRVVQLMGGMNTSSASIRPDVMTVRLANVFGGEAYVLFAPAIVDNSSLAELIKEESQYKKISAMFSALNVALVSVGVLNEENMLLTAGYLSKADYEVLKSKNCVGDVVMRFINIEGQLVDLEFNKRVMSIPLEDFKRIKTRIGVAYGAQKVKPIIGALKGKFINVLITDTETAKALLAQNTD